MKTDTLRGTAVTARVGLALGVAVAICFVTGLISHFIQHPQPWFFWPTRPVWLYRVTQGLHVISGIAAIPLIIVKLWSVWPKLFERPIIGGPVRQIERLSILVLVGSMLFQLSTGLLNIAQWYAFKFFFTTSHYAMAYVAVGAVLVHIGVKLPVIRRALGEPVDDTPVLVGPTRRTLLRGTWLAVALATVITAGQTIPLLRKVSVLAPRSGQGPQGVPINRSAIAAGVLRSARSPDYRLTVTNGSATRAFSLADLQAMPQATHRLPIACVEGWSVDAEWTGIVLADLVAAVGGSRDSDVRMISLEPPGPYSRTVLPARHARDTQTLIALKLNGQTLDLDHGYPCRLIAPHETRCVADEMAGARRGGGAVRFVLIVLGVAIGAYGAVLLWENPPVITMRILVWALVGVVLHDAVFAPVCVALGFVGRRLIPGKWWAPIALAVFCSVVLAFLAVPVYGKPGMRPDNMTVLDRNYPLGLSISLSVVWMCVLVYLLAARLLPVRQDEVVEQQSTDDVERQPPAL